jgi:hypothetical protein
MKSMRLIIVIIIIIHHELALDRRVPAYEIKLYHNLWNTFHKRFIVDGAGIEVFCIKANFIFGLTNERVSTSDRRSTFDAIYVAFHVVSICEN